MKSRLMKFTMGVATATMALGLLATNANATLMLQTGLVGGSGDVQNVLLTGVVPVGGSTTITGELNMTADQVDFTSSENLVILGGGQARIEAIDGSFTDIMFSLNDITQGFGKVQFNIDAAADGFADITLLDQFGTNFNFTNLALSGNGQNFFTGFSLDNQVIVKATINTTVAMTGISDLQQVRLGPADITAPCNPLDPTCVPGGVTTPEPGTLFLFGSGLAGLGLWRWKVAKKS